MKYWAPPPSTRRRPAADGGDSRAARGRASECVLDGRPARGALGQALLGALPRRRDQVLRRKPLRDPAQLAALAPALARTLIRPVLADHRTGVLDQRQGLEQICRDRLCRGRTPRRARRRARTGSWWTGCAWSNLLWVRPARVHLTDWACGHGLCGRPVGAGRPFFDGQRWRPSEAAAERGAHALCRGRHLVPRSVADSPRVKVRPSLR